MHVMNPATKRLTVCLIVASFFGVGAIWVSAASAQDPVQDKPPGRTPPRSLEQIDPERMDPERMDAEPFRRGGIRSAVSPAAAKSADPLVPSAADLFTRLGAGLPGVEEGSSPPSPTSTGRTGPICFSLAEIPTSTRSQPSTSSSRTARFSPRAPVSLA